MKKLLLGTSALVGASFVTTAAFAAPQVRLGGYMDFQAGFSSQDQEGFGSAPGVGATPTESGFGFVTDTEIIIRASDKFDNGLAWSVKIELEADSQDRARNDTGTANADEASITFSGSWGALTLGNEDGASDQTNMRNAGAISGIGAGGAKGWRRWTQTQGFANNMHTAFGDVNDTNDATKIIYFTPKIAGFQAGASYSRDNRDSGRVRAPATSISNRDYENWWEFGGSYETKLDDVGLGLAVTYNHASAKGANTIGGVSPDDVRGYSLSGYSTLGGFTLSLAYARENAINVADPGRRQVSYGGALKYVTGPYQVGVSYGRSEQKNRGTADFSSDVMTLGAAYTLGAGVVVYADTWHYTNDSGGTNTAGENSAIGMLVGTTVSF